MINRVKKNLKQDLKDLKKLDSATKISLIGFIIMLFIASILLGASYKLNETSSAQTLEAVPTAIPMTALSLSPTSQTLSKGETIKISVLLSKVPVQAANIVLNYDPAVLSVFNIQNEQVFQNVLNQKIEGGKITFSGSVDPATPTLTTGEVFSFSATTLVPSTSATIEFDKTATITSLNGENKLGLTVGGNYLIK